jgi:hypothetical protein
MLPNLILTTTQKDKNYYWKLRPRETNPSRKRLRESRDSTCLVLKHSKVRKQEEVL